MGENVGSSSVKLTDQPSLRESHDAKQFTPTLNNIAVNDSSHAAEHLCELLSFYRSYGRFEFWNRYDKEDIEWILNSPLCDGKTLLHVAVSEQHEDMIRDLLKLGGQFTAHLNFCTVNTLLT